MKPIYVKFRAFGPYLDEQIVDFSSLGSSGLFLICGETGSGKTTILDAITYALYGKSSGGLRGDISVMRCTFADENTDTEVEYVFSVNGETYKFARKIHFGRTKFTTTQQAFVMNDEGIFEPLFENPKIKDVEQKAQSIIGLTYEQFRQVIILPQGQFEKLLVSDSSEKEKILVSLFGAEKWQKIADGIYEKFDKERKLLDFEIQDINRKLSENGVATVSELEVKANELTDKFSVSKEQLKHADKLLKNSRKEQNKMQEINQRFILLDETSAKSEKLLSIESHITCLENDLKISANADKVNKVYEEYVRSRREEKRLEELYEKAVTEYKNAEKTLAETKTKLAEFEEKKPICDRYRLNIAELSSRRDIYSKLDNTKAQLIKAEQVVNEQKKVFADIETQLKKAETDVQTTREEQNNILLEHTRIFNLYKQNKAGILARELSDNSPCPVCGSLEHPKKAVITGEEVTDEMLKNADDKVQKITQLVKNKEQVYQNIKNSYNNASECYQQAQGNYTTTFAEYNSIVSAKIDGIENASQLENKISDIEKRLKKFEEQYSLLSEEIKILSNKESETKAKVDTISSEYTSKKKTVQQNKSAFTIKLSENNFDDEKSFLSVLKTEEEKDDIKKRIISYHADVKSTHEQLSKIKEELSGINRPDMKSIDENVKNQAQQREELLLLSKELETQSNTLVTLANSLNKRYEIFKEQDEKSNKNIAFAKQLRGDTGVGLQRYVLGTMLSAITMQANELLKNVHGGRYRLYRTQETAGRSRKSGLELEVSDSLSGGKRRSVVSLSGGEKFLVALSLSIGLSTVVQTRSSGIRLDAMFIDEGFGSLDGSSIGNALEILSRLRNTNGIVGIISHIDVLKENIPSCIEITKSRTGSSLDVKF